MQKILIVEDDEKLRDELKIFLNNNGYIAETLNNFEKTLNDILNIKPNLVLLDINLPNADGQYICRELRKVSDVPIIIVTSRESEIDELISINYGADYYITKPFNIQILLAKIATILRRANGGMKIQDKINLGEFILNTAKSTIERGDKKIEITKNEFRILKFLSENKGKIVSREEIIECLWDSESYIDDNTLTVNITRLRNRLEELELKDVIQTRRGQGYILV